MTWSRQYPKVPLPFNLRFRWHMGCSLAVSNCRTHLCRLSCYFV